jgi:sec-independent protein translocase protein TatC
MPEVISTKNKHKKLHARKEPAKRNLWDHLEKLRWHIIRSLLVVVALAIVAFLNRHLIFDTILLAPKEIDFPTNVFLCTVGKFLNIDALCFNAEALKIINVSMSGQFLTHLYVSLIAGIVLAFPYILYETWSYVSFVLKIRNKLATILSIIIGTLLFVAGLLFSYYLIVPLTVNFLGTYYVGDVQNHVALNSYIGTIASLVLGVGVIFELPVFIFILSKYGLVTPDFLRKKRKYMIVILLTISAIITPPDVISQIMVCLPLLLLYEISIWVSASVVRKGDHKTS